MTKTLHSCLLLMSKRRTCAYAACVHDAGYVLLMLRALQSASAVVGAEAESDIVSLFSP